MYKMKILIEELENILSCSIRIKKYPYYKMHMNMQITWCMRYQILFGFIFLFFFSYAIETKMDIIVKLKSKSGKY